MRQLVRSPGSLSEPERNRGRLAVCVFHPDFSLLDSQDAVGDISELEDVALQALDCEILVDCADKRRLRLEQHLVVGVVGNRAA